MKICAIVNSYPSREKPYPQFVHARLRAYKRKGHEVCALSYTPRNALNKSKIRSKRASYYYFEDVPVYVPTTIEESIRVVRKQSPDVLLVHLPTMFTIKIAEKTGVPYVVWVHGSEALSPWDLFKYHFRPRYSILLFFLSILNFPRYFINWFYVRNLIRRYVYERSDIGIVFVSNWMRNFSEQRWGLDLSDYPVIPNPIDSSIFSYTKRPYEYAFRIVTVRPFIKHKYAVDIAINAASLLDSRFYYYLYGDGPLYNYFERYFMEKKKWARSIMHLERRLFLQKELASLFSRMGIALYPTRLDSQGVAMCEAAATGLPVITSNFPAVKEFIKNGINGFTLDTPEEMAEKITWLAENPRKYAQMSKKGARYTQKLLDIEKITALELEYIGSFAHNK